MSNDFAALKFYSMLIALMELSKRKIGNSKIGNNQIW